LILSIETSGQVCSIALHQKGELVSGQVYNLQKSHSSLLPHVIQELLNNTGVEKQELLAVAVAAGPGSYTGLRIGVSTAKGLSFGLNIPLISFSTLDLLVHPLQGLMEQNQIAIPCIDARRMEIYAKGINHFGETVFKTTPIILEENSFSDYSDCKLIFVGSGANKCQIINHANYQIVENSFPNALEAGELVFQKFINNQFEDLAYFEPDYLKEFQTKPAKNLLA
jgi:tRNA threonylcarbamoyladenosine biosynthesis protein TsaB